MMTPVRRLRFQMPSGRSIPVGLDHGPSTVLLCVTTVSKKSRDCIDSGVCGLRHAHCKALHEKYEKYGTKHGPKRVVV